MIKTEEKIPGGGTIDHVENIIKIKWKLRQEYQSIGNKELYLITIRKAKSPVYFAKKTVNKWRFSNIKDIDNENEICGIKLKTKNGNQNLLVENVYWTIWNRSQMKMIKVGGLEVVMLDH